MPCIPWSGDTAAGGGDTHHIHIGEPDPPHDEILTTFDGFIEHRILVIGQWTNKKVDHTPTDGQTEENAAKHTKRMKAELSLSGCCVIHYTTMLKCHEKDFKTSCGHIPLVSEP